MKSNNVTFSVFTKPWKTQSIAELGEFISGLGFDGIEFPLRDGYQVEPANAETGLPMLVQQLGRFGLKITSIASPLDEQVFAGCAAAEIPLIRIMATHFDLQTSFFVSLEQKKKEIEAALPFCEKYGIKIGVQHHHGPGVSNSMELLRLVENYDPRYVGAIWDPAHSGLAGEEPEQGLDTVWSHLCLVNLKNAYYKQVNGPESLQAQWKRHFTSGREGLASWTRVADYLKNKGYQGVICLTAEYSETEQTNRLIAEDIVYAKSLF